VAPLASAARSEPAPSLLPFVTLATGAADAKGETSRDTSKEEARIGLIIFSDGKRKLGD
jgi:hypothetical protein